MAAAIAQALNLPLNAIGVRKISTPERPELAIGAIAEGDGSRFERLQPGVENKVEELLAR